MNSIVRLREPIEEIALPKSRADLIRGLMALTQQIGADAYLLAEIVSGNGEDDARIIASNWAFDTIEELGTEALAKMALAPQTSFLGAGARRMAMVDAAALCTVEAGLLVVNGHRDFVATRFRAHGATFFVMFSSAQDGRLDSGHMPQAAVTLSYALSALGADCPAATQSYQISERERECLHWVAEGKTTQDIATILGVSSNTINGYLSHVIQKLSARNRAMAIATAVRCGVI